MSPDYPARIGSYHVLGVIGTHRLGPVYRAYDEAQARVIALRVWSPRVVADAPAMERMRRESQALAALGHRNIVSVLDAGRDGDLFFTASEYVDGGSLVDRLRGTRPSVAEALQMVREVATGVAAAHAIGIVHGDLAPRHVLLSRDLSVIKVADFGVTSPPDASMAGQTMTGARMGAMLYRAPELLMGSGPADARSDIYSIGVIAYQALTGRMPVGKFGLCSDLNPQVSLAIDPMVIKCLSSDPAHRYQTVAALLADLDTLRDVRDYQVMSELNQLTGGRLFKKPGGALPRGPSRTPLYLGAAAVVVVLGIAADIVMQNRASAPADAGGTQAGAGGPVNPPAPPASPALPSVEFPKPAAPAAAVPSPAAAAAATPPPSPSAAPRSTAPPTPRPAVARPAAPATPIPVAPAPPKAAAAATKAPAPAVVNGTGPAKSPVAVDVNAVAGTLFNEAQSLITNKNVPEARKRLETIAAAYAGSSSFVPAMTAKIALEDREKIKEFDTIVGAQVPASLISRRRLIERAPQHPSAEAALWWLAETYDDLKRYLLAAETYARLGGTFPNTKYDAWFKAAEVYEKRLNQKDEARAAYLKVPASSSRYKDAQNRSQKLQAR